MTYMTLSGLSLRDIEYIVAVDDLRNFSRAAERCGVSQAGLSEQVRKLEAFLNVQLFERTRRHVAPRRMGRGLSIPRAMSWRPPAPWWRWRAHLMDRWKVFCASGLLRRSALLCPTPDPLIREKYPQLQLQLTEGLTDKLLERLVQTELDIVLAALPCDQTNLQSLPLFHEPFEAVFPKNHPLARKPRVDINSLRGNDLLLLEDGHCLRDQALSPLSIIRRRKSSPRYQPRNVVAYDWCRGRIFIDPQTGIAASDRVERLDSCLPVSEGGRQIGMVWRASDPRQQAFMEFGTFLRQHIPEGCQKVA